MMQERRSSLTLRLPKAVKDRVTVWAQENFTSLNDEIIRSIRERMEAAAGVEIGVHAPAAAQNTAALQGGDNTNG